MKTLFKQHTDWVEPDHFPNLSKYDEISIDLETKDPDLKTKDLHQQETKEMWLA